MARPKLPEFILMVLAALGGLGILFVIGTTLIQAAADRTAETGGIATVAGGFSASLLTIILFIVLAIVIVLAVFLWRR